MRGPFAPNRLVSDDFDAQLISGADSCLHSYREERGTSREPRIRAAGAGGVMDRKTAIIEQRLRQRGIEIGREHHIALTLSVTHTCPYQETRSIISKTKIHSRGNSKEEALCLVTPVYNHRPIDISVAIKNF